MISGGFDFGVHRDGQGPRWLKKIEAVQFFTCKGLPASMKTAGCREKN